MLFAISITFSNTGAKWRYDTNVSYLSSYGGRFIDHNGKLLILNEELKASIFEQIDDIKVEGVERVEANPERTLYIFYTSKDKKGELIGKNGKNIKALKKIYGDIVVKEIC